MTEIYFDNAATTKPCDEAADAATRLIKYSYGNPSSPHKLGADAKAELESARAIIANAMGADADEIIFTSGGTEANNLAIFGTCSARADAGRKIVTTTVEHASVTKTIRNWKRQGWQVEYAPIRGGELDLEFLVNAVDEQTVLVSVMMVNNEVGSVFPLRKIRDILDAKGSTALLHCDAVQGFGKVPFNAQELGADLISVSAHKIHGIKGCGALYVKRDTNLHALQFGGYQENGLRSGTESTPLIAAFGAAAKVTFANLQENISYLERLRDYFIGALTERVPEAVLNSDKNGAPHIVNFSLPGFNSDEIVQVLSDKGIYLSNKAACKSTSGKRRSPHALEAYGIGDALVWSAFRVSFSKYNTTSEIDALITELKQITK
ncbi:MAG: cysteine desulfurase [Oscillospiraceae bacterium]|jgi:cysteine desulfurase|nr:cysteine desulfurase [Oscillospiraceae bacterium]